jgi:hypothetical protein
VCVQFDNSPSLYKKLLIARKNHACMYCITYYGLGWLECPRGDILVVSVWAEFLRPNLEKNID